MTLEADVAVIAAPLDFPLCHTGTVLVEEEEVHVEVEVEVEALPDFHLCQKGRTLVEEAEVQVVEVGVHVVEAEAPGLRRMHSCSSRLIPLYVELSASPSQISLVYSLGSRPKSQQA